jgi:hypothetical protein
MTHQSCIYCNGVLLYGEPLHIHNYNGEDIAHCRDCSEYTASCSWPDDKWGPYPFTVFQRSYPAHLDA